MTSNIEKCHHMTITNKRKTISSQYYLGNDLIAETEMINYLGVIIDNKLSFKQHIQVKCKKATTVLNMLRRNLHFAPMSVKCKAYTATVLPIIEYASSCWGPTSKHLNNAIEMVQHNAAKFVTNRYPRKDNFHKFSISKLLQDLEWDSLEERRNNVRLTMAYKIINGLLILEPDLMPKMQFKRPVRGVNLIRKSNS